MALQNMQYNNPIQGFADALSKIGPVFFGSGTTNESATNIDPVTMHVLQQLISSGDYSKGAAVNDSTGVVRQLVMNALQEQMPQLLSADKAAGGYNSTTTKMLSNDLASRVALQGQEAVQKNIANYANIQANLAQQLRNDQQTHTAHTTPQVNAGSMLLHGLEAAGINHFAKAGWNKLFGTADAGAADGAGFDASLAAGQSGQASALESMFGPASGGDSFAAGLGQSGAADSALASFANSPITSSMFDTTDGVASLFAPGGGGAASDAAISNFSLSPSMAADANAALTPSTSAAIAPATTTAAATTAPAATTAGSTDTAAAANASTGATDASVAGASGADFGTAANTYMDASAGAGAAAADTGAYDSLYSGVSDFTATDTAATGADMAAGSAAASGIGSDLAAASPYVAAAMAAYHYAPQIGQALGSVAQDMGGVADAIGSGIGDVAHGVSSVVHDIGNACFITTAVCDYHGMADNCELLNIFRAFRDSWLKEHHPESIAQYYAEAPGIVEDIAKFKEPVKRSIYQTMLHVFLLPAASYITEGKPELAYIVYKNLFNVAKDLAASARGEDYGR